MFGLFKKKTQLEQLIAKDGIEHATARFAEIVSQKLHSREVAYQFILEELDGASQGNAAAQAFARNSGIPASAYSGALGNSNSEVDGPEGPQQVLLALSMQLMSNQALMAEFRCRVDDNVMKRFRLGKYAVINKTQPVHIDFGSYSPSMQMGNRTPPNPCTFLVTVTNPSFRPTVKTCRVSGINHKLSPHGVQGGVVAHVNMCRHTDEGEFERVFVQLLEDGRVEGLLVRDGAQERVTNLDDVYFMPGDTTWLDDAGEPLAPENQPRPLPAQMRLLEAEQEQMINRIMNR